MKKCPFCAEEIQDEAKVCRYCNKKIPIKTIFNQIILWIVVGIIFILICSDFKHAFSQSQHYTDQFTTDGIQTVFPLSHKFTPGTLKVYFTPPVKTQEDWDYVKQNGIEKFREVFTLEEKEGSWQLGSDGKSIVVTSFDTQCAVSNADKGCMMSMAKRVNCPCPIIGYESGWGFEASYDASDSSDNQTNANNTDQPVQVTSSNTETQASPVVQTQQSQVVDRWTPQYEKLDADYKIGLITKDQLDAGYKAITDDRILHASPIVPGQLPAKQNANDAGNDSNNTAQPTQATSRGTQAVDLTESYTVNVSNSRGGYTAIVIKKSGGGFIGPNGEYYSKFPTVSQLKLVYGLN